MALQQKAALHHFMHIVENFFGAKNTCLTHPIRIIIAPTDTVIDTILRKTP